MQDIILKNLKALRIFLGLSVPQFADAVGASTSLVYQVERGEIEPSAGFIALVCQAFHIRPDTVYREDMASKFVEVVNSGGVNGSESGENGGDPA